MANISLVAFIAFGSSLDTNTWHYLNESIERLKAHDSKQHKVLFDECSKLISDYSKEKYGDEAVLDREQIPVVLGFLTPIFIRYDEKKCTIFLYKVPGKGIGYTVSKHGEEKNRLFWFNDFESWNRHEIALTL